MVYYEDRHITHVNINLKISLLCLLQLRTVTRNNFCRKVTDDVSILHPKQIHEYNGS